MKQVGGVVFTAASYRLNTSDMSKSVNWHTSGSAANKFSIIENPMALATYLYYLGKNASKHGKKMQFHTSDFKAACKLHFLHEPNSCIQYKTQYSAMRKNSNPKARSKRYIEVFFWHSG